MPRPPDVYWAFYERQHKILGIYLVFRAWQLGVDNVALRRSSLLEFLHLTNMSDEQLKRIKGDLKEFFPYSWETSYKGSDTHATLYLSRFEIPEQGKIGDMRDDERIQKFQQLGLKSAVLEVPDERKIVTSMALLSNGLSTLTDFSV